MLKNVNKCCEIDYSDSYNSILNSIANPYGYNFGIINNRFHDNQKIKNRTNPNYLK